MDTGKIKGTNKTEDDTATEAFEPGGGVTEVIHAFDNEIQDEILSVTKTP